MKKILKNSKVKIAKKIIKASAPKRIEVRFPDWEVLSYKNTAIMKPILIEGMPGIGNVGKICMDLLIEETSADKIMSFFSYGLPNSVFVNEDNLVQLPQIVLYHKRIGGQDFLFLTGDVQPMTEKASYEFSELIIDLFRHFKGKYIVTLGGIGLSEIPENPKIFLTGNDKLFVEKISKSFDKKKLKHEKKIYGHVGPILGVSGLLLGISSKHDVPAFSLLAETFGHPIYVGLKGTKAILNILNTYFSIGLKFEKLDKEIKHIDNQMKGISNGDAESGDSLKYKKFSDVNYIG